MYCRIYPAQLIFLALDQNDLDRRFAAELQWLAYTYAGIDWEWLVRSAKLNDRQIRLRHPPCLWVGMSRCTEDHTL